MFELYKAIFIRKLYTCSFMRNYDKQELMQNKRSPWFLKCFVYKFFSARNLNKRMQGIVLRSKGLLGF